MQNTGLGFPSKWFLSCKIPRWHSCCKSDLDFCKGLYLFFKLSRRNSSQGYPLGLYRNCHMDIWLRICIPHKLCQYGLVNMLEKYVSWPCKWPLQLRRPLAEFPTWSVSYHTIQFNAPHIPPFPRPYNSNKKKINVLRFMRGIVEEKMRLPKHTFLRVWNVYGYYMEHIFFYFNNNNNSDTGYLLEF